MPFSYRKCAENHASYESDVLLGWDERYSCVTQDEVETQLVTYLHSDAFAQSLCRLLLRCSAPKEALVRCTSIIVLSEIAPICCSANEVIWAACSIARFLLRVAEVTKVR